MSDNNLTKKTDENSSGESGKKSSSSNRQHYRWMGFGIELGGVIGFFMWLGHLADEKFQTQRPWWMLTGFALAFLGMMYPLVKDAMGLNQREKKK